MAVVDLLLHTLRITLRKSGVAVSSSVIGSNYPITELETATRTPLFRRVIVGDLQQPRADNTFVAEYTDDNSYIRKS